MLPSDDAGTRLTTDQDVDLQERTEADTILDCEDSTPRRALDAPGLANAAQLIDDLLTESGATAADRQAIADHLTGRSRLDAGSAPAHDSWALTTALAQSWHLYSQRAQVPPAVLLDVLDGACGLVTQYVDTETTARILEATQEEATADEVAELVHWMEREDLWDNALTAQQVRAAWSAYRDHHLRQAVPA